MISYFSSYKEAVFDSELEIPGDKSISHRAIILASLANGVSKIRNLLESHDVFNTISAMKNMGVSIEKIEDYWRVNGVGFCGLLEPKDILYMGNSGTSARLLIGLVSSFSFKSFFGGDASLSKRPMGRVFDLLKNIGVSVVSREDNFLPSVVIGKDDNIPIDHFMEIPSAQVKSAILLSAINISGLTTITENIPSRDHTENMMRYFGINVKSKVIKYKNAKVNKISLIGRNEFFAKDFDIARDISSAAFFIVMTLITKDSKIKMKSIGINPLRDGIIRILKEMGARIELSNIRILANEKVADITVYYSKLHGVDVSSDYAVQMIDEYPILSIAAAHADGVTKMTNLGELKVKESNRLEAIYCGLKACGVCVTISNDSLEIKGGIKSPNKVVDIKTSLDHRIAMSFLIMGCSLRYGVKVDDIECIKTSFPNFVNLFESLRV